MKKLVILRGAPASGKSTFVSNQGLDAYALCPDNLRIQLGGVVLSKDGRLTINHNNDKAVWSLVEETLERKMRNGEFIVFDATFQRKRDFKMPLTLAEKYRYEVLCIDFSDLAQEDAIKRNLQRPAYKQVPEEIIIHAYEIFSQSKIPESLEVISHKEFKNKSLIEYLDVKCITLDKYDKIHHIGDIQGCFAPVKEYFNNDFKENEFYIFIGDFLDRGIQNGEVVRWLIDEVIDRPNAVLIWGNHETHIHSFAKDQVAASKEFTNNTLPQLKEAGFTQIEADKLCNKLHDCFLYKYNDVKCLVTHAGLSKVPDNPILIPSTQYLKGTGTFEHPVDEVFTKNMQDTNWIQVHGHRNSHGLPIKAADKSYNLEEEIEFGGYLRVLTFGKDGEETIKIKNNIFRKDFNKFIEGNSENCINQEYKKISIETLEKLTSNELVSIKKFKTYPHINSYNFSKRAFYKGFWDKVNITARGLFIDHNRNIVARSYNKFFNLEERPETEMRNLQNNLVFPINLYVKENGFLGILGYDEVTEELFFTSKSTPESDFARWFREILTNTISPNKLEELKLLLRNKNLSMIFEVNDPLRDPHLIDYDKPHVVLLDIVYRTENFSKLTYNELHKVATDYGLHCKKRAMTFKNWEKFNAWFQSVRKSGINYSFKGKHIEGFVVEDSTGFLFKIKLPYYSFWKDMRSLKERLITIRQSGGNLKRDISDPKAENFYEWLKQQPDEVLNMDIITVRKMYMQSGN